MKLVMINDCAFVGETLLKYMPPDIDKLHIERSRGFWSKTFGLAYKILRVRGDVYHVHYLLQDCYIALRLGKKPLIGHAHGSDLRKSLKHSLWKRIVKHNLKNCDKVLVSTPDVLCIAKQFREDAEYLPNPVDTEFFYPKPIREHSGKKRVLIASDSDWKVKGTNMVIRALSRIKDTVNVSVIRYGVDFSKTVALASSLGLHLNILPQVPHEKLNNYYWNADVVIDRLTLGSLGLVSLEAIACGRPAVVYASSEYPEYRNFPLKDVDNEDKAAHVLEKTDNELWKKEYDYLINEHKISMVLDKVIKIYDSLTGC